MRLPNRRGGRSVKVVFIIDSLRRHGTQRFLIHLVRGLHNLGHEHSVITLNSACDHDIEEALAAAGCAITRIGKWGLLLAGIGWWRLVATLKRLRPDVVMTMLDFADILGPPAAQLAGCQALVTAIRARNLAKPSWQRWLTRTTVRWADKVVFNSRQVVEYARQHEGILEEQVVVIPNGVEDLFARSGALRSSYRQQLGLQPETILLGSVGRLYPQKNVSLLLHACANLSTLRPWMVLVLGDGPERQRLLSLAHELRLADRLIWLGARDDVEGWLAAMDIFVHTANFEGMPNAVMEAMAMRLPVVATNVDGLRDLIEEDASGCLLSPGDINGFAERIGELIENPDLARRLGEKGHDDVLERFGMTRMIRAYDHLFHSLAPP
jgi:glycosyltransferase involved in cell wall biosynthesis